MSKELQYILARLYWGGTGDRAEGQDKVMLWKTEKHRQSRTGNRKLKVSKLRGRIEKVPL